MDLEKAVVLKSGRQNILFFMTDNQRADLLGCAGNPIIQTPILDKLAKFGIRFSNAFSTTPICSASRASYFSGLYERQHRFTFSSPPFSKVYTDVSYPTLLKSSGYWTGLIGKFGLCTHGIEPSLEDPNALYTMFDVFDNYEHWTPEGYEIKQPHGNVRHLTDITGDKAIGFLGSYYHNQSHQPFYLSVNFNAPHAQDGYSRPYICPKSENYLYMDSDIPEPVNSHPNFFDELPIFIRKSENRKRWYERFAKYEDFQQNIRGLYRMVTGVDRNIGRIVNEIGRLSLTENTIIIFASDHGMYYGERGLSDCWQMNEESIRIPLIVFDPKSRKINKGKVRNEMVLNIDLAPTILELAGLLPHPIMQGRSLVPLLQG